MSSTMFGRVTLSVLLLGFLVFRGVLSLENSDAGGRHPGILDLPWKDQLCCESHAASTVEGDTAPAERPNGSNRSLPHDSQCSFKNLASKLHRLGFSGTCLDILCGIDEKWENVTCHLEPHTPRSSLPGAGHVAVSLQRRFQKSKAAVDSEEAASDPPVFCEAEHSFACSVALDAEGSFHAVVTVSIADARAPSVLLRVPARPVKPAPPVNLSHAQTIEAELILHWVDPKDFKTDLLQYEVRYSPDAIHPAWQVMSVSGDTKTSLDLKACVNYTVQVRRSGRSDPPLWSRWSESHHIFLDEVSYIPEKVVVKAGENVTVYCVFNDHNFNASTASWILNFDQDLDYSLYHPINQWVSQVTMRPSETGMYDLLQCTKKWIPYSQVYVEGASISISCETNGDIDAMDCRWNSTQWQNPNFRTRWADLSCDVMEERERAGDNVGHEGPSCLQVDSRKRLCTIQPLRTNCYKLWLELPSHLGPIRSKPVYLTPNDHVKPHPPTDVKAVSGTDGVLMVTWQPPYLPVEVQCQFRYHSPSAVHPKPDWKVQAIVREPWAEVTISGVCLVFVVQVRCMHVSGTGYWSEWSQSVYSSPQNSRAPERGPNFWRFLQDDPLRKQTNVTLLFERLQTSGQPYCVDGFLVKRLGSTGSVVQERISMASSYSFEWNQMPQTVTVEAYNSLGSSSDNLNMTLEKTPKRRCVHHFSVTVINSTCVSLSWTLIDKSSPPIFMVVQWSLLWKQDSGRPRDQSADTWARLPYTDGPTYLSGRGNFFGSEDYGFYLYPVFANGEGEPAFATATRGDPAIYMMLMIISFLSIVLLISLILSQNQMKKLMWKDVPNPNRCSWARGIDLNKANAFDHMFHPPEGFPAWPLLLPPEKISSLVIVDKADLSALGNPPDPSVASTVRLHGEPDSQVGQAWPEESHLLPGGEGSSPPDLDYPTGSAPDDGGCPAGVADSSAQSSVIYTTVLLCGPQQQQQQQHHLHDKDCSCSSSSDEGNFSANNSDISASFNGGLWELDVPRRSCCYNSMEELSEKSEQGDRDVGEEKDLYYIGVDYGDDDEESEEELNAKLIQTVPLNNEGCSAESHRLLQSTCNFSPLYLPQFRTAPSGTRQLSAKPQEGRCHP